MKKCRKNCGFVEGIISKPLDGCRGYVPALKKYVLLHLYHDTGFISIVAFSNDDLELEVLRLSQPHYGSNRHLYLIVNNDSSGFDSLSFVKDMNLINICKNVAEYLSIAEYAMLKKSYFKSSSWFEKAKDSASLASEILENY